MTKLTEENRIDLAYYQAYFDALLWCEELEQDYCQTDFDNESLLKQLNDLNGFFEQASEIIENSDYTIDQACHDFFFTRNGHGVGFWECDHCNGEQGQQLTEIAQSFGEIHIYVGDDKKVYIS